MIGLVEYGNATEEDFAGVEEKMGEIIRVPSGRPIVKMFGASNGNSKLTNQQVRQLRADRAAKGVPPDFRVLGERYGISAKQARNICYGLSRKEAGGVIEQPVKDDEEDDLFQMIVHGSPFDMKKPPIRCRLCRAKAYRSRVDPTICYGCVASQAA